MPTFADRLQQTLAEAPDRPAIHLLQNRLPDIHLTYRALLLGAGGYARALAQASIGPDDVVVLILQHGEALLYAFWGAVLQGAIPSIMPFLTEKLSPEKYRQDLAALIEVTRPAAIVTYPEFEARGNVIVRNEIKNEQLNTEHLIWDERNHRIYNNDPIKVITPGKILYGNDLESDETFTRYTFKNPTGHMMVRKDSV